ncbi:MAG: (2Fe-2S)-binding protein [Chloroflexota bacterium]|nr:(2Fe-2S)-binding protein [Chloroflexota bacterium]
MIVRFRLNGESVVQVVKPNETLLDVLRDRIKLHSVKKGCDEGLCGTCTVILNGVPVRSCLMLAVQANDADIITVEGLAKLGTLSEIQQAFLEKNGFQCGFCTSGMMLTAKVLLDSNPKPSLDDIKDAFDGQLCRCTGYEQIIESVQRAAELRTAKK